LSEVELAPTLFSTCITFFLASVKKRKIHSYLSYLKHIISTSKLFAEYPEKIKKLSVFDIARPCHPTRIPKLTILPPMSSFVLITLLKLLLVTNTLLIKKNKPFAVQLLMAKENASS
jgi:hypothetical protein